MTWPTRPPPLHDDPAWMHARWRLGTVIAAILTPVVLWLAWTAYTSWPRPGPDDRLAGVIADERRCADLRAVIRDVAEVLDTDRIVRCHLERAATLGDIDEIIGGLDNHQSTDVARGRFLGRAEATLSLCFVRDSDSKIQSAWLPPVDDHTTADQWRAIRAHVADGWRHSQVGGIWRGAL